jgi:hypothetical protein
MSLLTCFSSCSLHSASSLDARSSELSLTSWWGVCSPETIFVKRARFFGSFTLKRILLLAKSNVNKMQFTFALKNSTHSTQKTNNQLILYLNFALYLEPTSLNRANSSSSMVVARPLSSFSLTFTSLHSSVLALKTSCREFRTLSLVASVLLCFLGTCSTVLLLATITSLTGGFGAIAFNGVPAAFETTFTTVFFTPGIVGDPFVSILMVFTGVPGGFPV